MKISFSVQRGHVTEATIRRTKEGSFDLVMSQQTGREGDEVYSHRTYSVAVAGREEVVDELSRVAADAVEGDSNAAMLRFAKVFVSASRSRRMRGDFVFDLIERRGHVYIESSFFSEPLYCGTLD